MPRSIPEPPDSWTPPDPPVGQQFKFELITPLFGGGVITRENDTSFPFRPTAIRGQLEFWWRATVGAHYDREQLRRQQSAIWGDTEQASRVQVIVEKQDAANPVPCAKFERDPKDAGKFRSMPTWERPFLGTAIPYALFPFQGQCAPGNRTIKVQPASCMLRGTFLLRIICPEALWQDVRTALWAWSNFGGLGSRTRRGCGAIRCSALAPKDRQELMKSLKPFVGHSPVSPWPTFARAVLVGKEMVKADAAWNDLIQLLRDFRQKPGLGRNPGATPNRPGRSRWPEPETIRRATGRRNPKHARMQGIPDDAFPRAEFGLPIVFHFKDTKLGDPEDTVLYPGPDDAGNARERMASPLILRPLALQNNRFVPVIICLRTPALQDVLLKSNNQSLCLPFTPVVAHPRLASYANSPLANRSAKGSALEAFLAYARSQGYTEVTP